MASTLNVHERRFSAQDWLSPYFGDYSNHARVSLPLLYLAGLTGDSKNFHELACRLAPRRVLCLDYCGHTPALNEPVWIETIDSFLSALEP